MAEDRRRNPFLPPEVEAEPVEVIESDPVLGDGVEVRGPSAPMHSPRAPERRPAVLEPAEPVVPVTGTTLVVGLHGGAGVTTLVSLLGDSAIDGGSQLPASNPFVSQAPRVVLVARTHARGLEAADQSTTAWSHGELTGLDLVGLVLVDDGPKLSPATRQAVARLLRKTPHGWHIPWVEAWRTTATPAVSGVRIPRTIRSIRRAAGAPATSKGLSS